MSATPSRAPHRPDPPARSLRPARAPLAPRPSAPSARTRQTQRHIAQLLARAAALFGADPLQPSELAPLEARARVVLRDARAALDDAQMHHPRAPLANVTAMAHGAVAQSLDAIGRETAAPWQRVAACEEALQSVRHALYAVDAAVAESEGVAPLPDEREAETAVALRIRAMYVALRGAVLGDTLPDSETIDARLRRAGNLIARLLGSEVAPHLRAYDRFMLRNFQWRIAEVLRRARDVSTLDLLTMLWEDLSSFAALLLSVNQRAVLRAWDRAACERALDLLAPYGSSNACPPEVREALRASLGRDDELDAACRGVGTVGELRAALHRVHDALDDTRTSGPRDSWHTLL